MEAVFAVAIVSVLFITVYGAMSSSISTVARCQENERATQIMTEKLDTIRLYNWTQMTNTGFVPTTFTARIDPLQTNSRIAFTGSIAVATAPISEGYKSNLLQVTVRLDWSAGNRPMSRSMVTYVAKYGLQSYILR
jgi:hypothetical protein